MKLTGGTVLNVRVNSGSAFILSSAELNETRIEQKVSSVPLRSYNNVAFFQHFHYEISI